MHKIKSMIEQWADAKHLNSSRMLNRNKLWSRINYNECSTNRSISHDFRPGTWLCFFDRKIWFTAKASTASLILKSSAAKTQQVALQQK